MIAVAAPKLVHWFQQNASAAELSFLEFAGVFNVLNFFVPISGVKMHEVILAMNEKPSPIITDELRHDNNLNNVIQNTAAFNYMG